MEFLIDGYTVHVDEEDAHLFDGRLWRAFEPSGKGKIYIRWQYSKGGKVFCVYLHRLIMNAPKGTVVDHRDSDTFNCRRGNLRVSDYVTNARNCIKSRRTKTSSRFKGVTMNRGKWRAQIRDSITQRHIGMFKNEVEAAYAYDLASMRIHGEQGRTNFLPLVI